MLRMMGERSTSSVQRTIALYGSLLSKVIWFEQKHGGGNYRPYMGVRAKKFRILVGNRSLLRLSE